MTSPRSALLIGLVLAVVAAPLDAQNRRRARSAAPGWIGISFEASYSRRGSATSVRITDVNEGSPAEAAGIRAGDRLLAVNELDRPSELANLAERLRLRAGDRVLMVVERDGRRREFRLRAAARPQRFQPSQRLEVSFEPDSMVRTMVRAMDSLRVRLVEERAQTIHVIGEAPNPKGRVTVVTGGQNNVRAPFEYFVFRGEEHDSLRVEMDELNRAMADLQDRMAERSRELERMAGNGGRVRLSEDRVYARLQEQMDTAVRRSANLQSAMADAARTNAGFDYSVEVGPRADQPVIASAPRQEFRPLTPYLLGRNRVAGAEVIDLQPELAAYFEVERGVLVVDVTPRTPAAISGIVPGDVITRLDQVVVSSVEDLRFGVSQAGDTLPVTLIRRGNSVQVLLRR